MYRPSSISDTFVSVELAGDMEFGRSKDKCTKCCKKVTAWQDALECDICKFWIHRMCGTMRLRYEVQSHRIFEHHQEHQHLTGRVLTDALTKRYCCSKAPGLSAFRWTMSLVCIKLCHSCTTVLQSQAWANKGTVSLSTIDISVQLRFSKCPIASCGLLQVSCGCPAPLRPTSSVLRLSDRIDPISSTGTLPVNWVLFFTE